MVEINVRELNVKISESKPDGETNHVIPPDRLKVNYQKYGHQNY